MGRGCWDHRWVDGVGWDHCRLWTPVIGHRCRSRGHALIRGLLLLLLLRVEFVIGAKGTRALGSNARRHGRVFHQGWRRVDATRTTVAIRFARAARRSSPCSRDDLRSNVTFVIAIRHSTLEWKRRLPFCVSDAP